MTERVAETIRLMLHPCESLDYAEDGRVGVRLKREEAQRVYRSIGNLLYGAGQVTADEAAVVLAALYMVEADADLPSRDLKILREVIDKLERIGQRP